MKKALESSHSIRLYFPYTFNSNAKPSEYIAFSEKLDFLKINSLVYSAPFLSDDIHDNLMGTSIWQKDHCSLDKNIHDFADKLVNGTENTEFSDGFFGMQPIKLTSDAIRVLNLGSPQSLGSGITISLKDAAIKRLQKKEISAPLEDNSWPLMFNDVWFYGLNMGIGMMVLDISICQPKNKLPIKHIEELLEINYIICRNNNNNESAKVNWGKRTKSITKGLSVLVDAILPTSFGESIKLKATKDRSNTYAYTFFTSNQEIDSLKRKKYIFRMARKYNDLYLPESLDEQIVFFEPFKPITHAFSLEGAVSFIDLTSYEKPPESIQNFGKTVIPRAYAPMILLTYAEYIFLREMESSTTDERVDMRNPTAENLTKLRAFRSKIYDFRLNYRYAQISGNTNHNIFCNTNKKSLETSKLLKEISSDMQEIELYISDHVSQKQETRLKNFGILGSLFAVIIGWVEIWGLSLHEILFLSPNVNKYSVSIFISVLLLLCLMIYFIHKNPDKTN